MKLKTYNRKIDKFLDDLDYICQENAVQIIFTSKNYVKCDGINCSGYFNENKRELVCALKTDNKTWLSTLVHESCHLDQWREQSAIWQLFDKSTANNEDIIDKWLLKKEQIDNTLLDEAFKITKEMEWDAEKRSIEKIKKYNLPIDIDEYTKKSVVYIMLYDFVQKYQTWYKSGCSPCRKKDIYNLVPSNYDLNLLPTITEEIEIKMKKYILGEGNGKT